MTSEELNLGKNRLTTGFSQSSSNANSILNPNDKSKLGRPELTSSTDDSQDDFISISDDEMEEGGMLINVASPEQSMQRIHQLPISDGDNDDETEVGEIHSSSPDSSFSGPTDPKPLIQDRVNSASKNTTTAQRAQSLTKLVDLSPAEFEDQLKYALYHLNRNEIDLNRPVVCLQCFQEGHMDSNCPGRICAHCGEIGKHVTACCPKNARCGKCRERGHAIQSCTSDMRVTTVPCEQCGSLRHTEEVCNQRFFPKVQMDKKVPLRLWISCCICASKSHLVGDCSYANQSEVVRWSLKALDPDQIINLSLQTGTTRLEKEAENRGMRPQGLQIKGRAGLHHAGGPRSEPVSGDDDDEPFLHPRINRPRSPPSHFRFGHSDSQRSNDVTAGGDGSRYDRFQAPTDDRQYLSAPRNDWYSTDSFGKRRSRSPESGRPYQQSYYRPDDRQNRRPSPPRRGGPQRSDQGWRRQRSRSPLGGNNTQYKGPDSRKNPFQPPANSTSRNDRSTNPKNQGAKPRSLERSNIEIKLPTRKGSNNWLNASNDTPPPTISPSIPNNSVPSGFVGSSSQPNKQNNSAETGGKRRKRSKNKNKNPNP